MAPLEDDDASLLRDNCADETKNKSLKHLRAYLEMADSGTRALDSGRTRRPMKDLHREDVAEALRERGYAVTTDVGLSDFRVDLAVARHEAPDHPSAAVLLDGPEWGNRRTIGDRNALPIEVLGGLLNWPQVARVWLPSWLADKEEVLDQLEAEFSATERPAATSVESGPRRVEPSPDGHPRVSESEAGADHFDDFEPADDVWSSLLSTVHAEATATEERATAVATSSSATAEFTPWNSGSRGFRDVLDELEWSDRAREQVRRVAVEAIDAEMAIHRDRLAKLVAGAFDLTRVNASRATSILAQVPRAHYKGDEPEVLWSTAVEPSTWQAARGDAAGTRSVDHIPPTRDLERHGRRVCRLRRSRPE